jgi:hypothetical protein
LSSDAEKGAPKAAGFDAAGAASAVWVEAQRALAADRPEEFSNEAVQHLMTAAVKLFNAKQEKDDRTFSPVVGDGNSVTATEVVVAVSALMRAASLNPFDLAMWFNRQPN